MTRRFCGEKLEAAQEDLFLAEIAREDEKTLTITLAGPGRIVMFECSGLSAFLLAHESLDPDVLPRELILDDEFLLSSITEFEATNEISARLREVSKEYTQDVLLASKFTSLDGDLDTLISAPLHLNLRIESWRLEPQPIDLHLLIGCEDLVLADEDGEIDIKANDGVITNPVSKNPAPKYTPPSESAYEVEPSELPPEMESTLRLFFESGLSDDFVTLARVIANFEMSAAEHEAYLAEHYHALFDWSYARALESWCQQGDLANVRMRGIIHSRAEDGISAINEECVWSFSMAKRAQGWIIRNWSTSWPSVGSAPSLSADQKTWLTSWSSGPVI